MGLDLAGKSLARTVQSNAVTDPKDRAAILTEFSVILAAIFWGTNFAATKFAALSIPPLLLVAFRFCAGGLLMYGVLRLLEPESRLGRKDLFPMAALGCLGVGTAQTGFTFGLSMTSAASTGLIFSTAPVWGMLLGSVLGHERPTGRGVVGVALSIVGVGVVFYEGLGAGSTSLIGNLWVLLAAVSVGVYTVLSVPLLERHTPLTVATYPILFGGPFVLLLSSPQLLNLGWGARERGGVGGGRVVGGVRHRFRLRWVAEGHKPHRGQPDANLPIPDYSRGGRFGHRVFRREARGREGRRWGGHPSRGLLGSPSIGTGLLPSGAITFTAICPSPSRGSSEALETFRSGE